MAICEKQFFKYKIKTVINSEKWLFIEGKCEKWLRYFSNITEINYL